MTPIEKHIELIRTLDKHLVNITQRDMSYILEKSGELESFLRDEFPGSDVKNLLVVFRRELNDLRGQSLANALDVTSVTQKLNNWVLRFQVFLVDIEEYLKNESARQYLETVAREQLTAERKIEKAYRAFTELSFDLDQRIKFNIELANAQSLAFLVHGKPYHGQKWLYNRLLRLHELLAGEPIALHRVIDLTAKSPGDALSDIKMDFAAVLNLHPQGTQEEVIRRLQDSLLERNVLIAFKNPTPEVLPSIKRFYGQLIDRLEPNLLKRKLIFVFLLDRVETGANMPQLSPVDARIFKEWVKKCAGENLASIVNLYANILEKDEGYICRKIIEIKRPPGGDFFGWNPEEDNNPTIPAETLIKKITQGQLNLDWEKCRQLWMPY